MAQPSDHLGLEPTQHRGKRVSFDPTINLGHVLTFVGLLAAMSVGWNTMDKRLTIQEVRTANIESEAQAEKGRIRESLGEIKSDMRDVKRGIDQLNQKGK